MKIERKQVKTDTVVLEDIPFRAEFERIAKKLRVKEGSANAEELRRLLEEAQAVARPRALYGVAYVSSRTEETVSLDGHTFESRVLRVNLADVHRVFPYVATCGMELHEWKSSIDDMLQSYYADTINETALNAARRALKTHLIEQYALGRTATMSPGSLKDWPIREQRPLFALLGDPEEAIGVRLSDSMLMIPSKSVSGIRFPTEERFESCQLCPREGCPSRKALYDENLYEKKFSRSDGAGESSP
jgi:hypothetical protein